MFRLLFSDEFQRSCMVQLSAAEIKRDLKESLAQMEERLKCDVRHALGELFGTEGAIATRAQPKPFAGSSQDLPIRCPSESLVDSKHLSIIDRNVVPAEHASLPRWLIVSATAVVPTVSPVPVDYQPDNRNNAEASPLPPTPEILTGVESEPDFSPGTTPVLPRWPGTPPVLPHWRESCGAQEGAGTQATKTAGSRATSAVMMRSVSRDGAS